MKKLFITALLIGSFIAVQAQTAPQPAKEQPIYIKLLPSQLNALQQVLQYSFQWLPKSSAPSNEVLQVLEVTKQIFPVLVADSTKRQSVTLPVKKKQ